VALDDSFDAPFLVDDLNETMTVALQQFSDLVDRAAVAGVFVVKECNLQMCTSTFSDSSFEPIHAGRFFAHTVVYAHPRLER
jgi:hypothetical protein